MLVQPGPSRLTTWEVFFFLEQLESTLGVKRVFRFAQGDGVEGKILLLSLSIYLYSKPKKRLKNKLILWGVVFCLDLGPFFFLLLLS